jgi:hypothetical protein
MGSRPEPAPELVGKPPRFGYPEKLTVEEEAQVQHVLPVDGEAYVRWLRGEGPDPCPPESSD